MLYGGCTRFPADRFQQAFAFLARRVGNADLDQFMGREVALDFSQNRGR